MKKLFVLSLLALTFNANATVINGLDIDQKWNCKVQKIYSLPYDPVYKKPIEVKIGDRLLIEQETRIMSNPTIRDLAEDTPFKVGKYEEWFYQELEKAPSIYEKQCKGPCIIYSTGRGGRWVFQPQRNGTMIAYFDAATHPDFKHGKRQLGFKCLKTSR